MMGCKGKCVAVQSRWHGEVEAGVNRQAVGGLYVVLLYSTSYEYFVSAAVRLQ
jgi:hypothetical protein